MTGCDAGGGWTRACTPSNRPSLVVEDPPFAGKWGDHFMFDSASTQNSKYSIRSVSVTKE